MTLERNDIRRHLSGGFNEDLDALMAHIREMGRLVCEQLRDALNALQHGDPALARQVVARDPLVNSLELHLDEECRDLLVRRQPAAGDLRLVFAVLKAVIDLERMGDLAKRVAKAVPEVSGALQQRFGTPISELGELVLALSDRSVHAFAEFDGQAVARVKQEDRVVDARCRAITDDLESFIMAAPDQTRGALHLIWATRALERFGDHAKNIAEYIYYAVSGKEVRHMSDEERSLWLADSAQSPDLQP